MAWVACIHCGDGTAHAVPTEDGELTWPIMSPTSRSDVTCHVPSTTMNNLMRMSREIGPGRFVDFLRCVGRDPHMRRTEFTLLKIYYICRSVAENILPEDDDGRTEGYRAHVDWAKQYAHGRTIFR